MLLKNVFKIGLLGFVFCINAAEGEVEPGAVNQNYEHLDDHQVGQQANVQISHAEGQPDSHLEAINNSKRIYDFSKRIWLNTLKHIVNYGDFYDALVALFTNNLNIPSSNKIFNDKIKHKFSNLGHAMIRPEVLIFNGILVIRYIDNNQTKFMIFMSEYPEYLNNLTEHQSRFIEDLNAIDDELIRHYYTEKTDNIRHDDVQSLLNYFSARNNIYFKDIMSHCQISKAGVLEMLNSFTQEQREIIENAYMIKEEDGCCVVN